ncbi:unnamed protein product, partial [Choristocarpus tenellus]
QGKPHVPFRDSKLTRLLQQSLGGNASTAIVVTIPPGRDDQGESLSALLFGQRALSVHVLARINQKTDFEQLCQDLQRRLDAKGDEATKLEVDKVALEQVCTLRSQKVLATRNYEVNRKKHTNQDALTFSEASDDPSGERAVAAIETVNSKWRAELECVQEKHDHQIEDVRRVFGERIQAYKSAAASASEEWSSSEYELTKEREGHVATLRELRSCHNQARTQEKDSNNRIR